MDSIQLHRALSLNVYTRKAFLGIFASDQLPLRIPHYPACFIANVDAASESGSHWLAFYLSSPHHLEFFDSFGHEPFDFPGPIRNFARRFTYVNYNMMILQSNVTAVCGQYCIYYLYSKCRGRSLNDVLSYFVPHELCNDRNVYNFVTRHFRVRAPFYQ